MLITIAFILAVFVIGFLLGELRATRECNRLLDERTSDLLDIMADRDKPDPEANAAEVGKSVRQIRH